MVIMSNIFYLVCIALLTMIFIRLGRGQRGQ